MKTFYILSFLFIAIISQVSAYSLSNTRGINKINAFNAVSSSSVNTLSNRLVKHNSYKSPTRLAFKTFDEMLVELEVPVLVDFYAQWCGPCKMMVPVLEDIAGRMENDIKVAKVDTDKSPNLGHRYQVEALPTLILFNKGQVLDRYVGYMTADELEKAVKSTLKRYSL